MSDTHRQWNSGSKEWGTTFCGQGTWNLELSEEPTCEKCQREMSRERFRIGHCEMIKTEGDCKYYIEERRKHNFGLMRDTVAQFDRRVDRDDIYEAMRLGGYCGHSNKSWIRSIPPLEWLWRTPPGKKRLWMVR
jgi:hypothetical protein